MNIREYVQIEQRSILDRIDNAWASRWKASDGAACNQAMNAIDVLRAVVEEVSGASQPFSADSYLPPHMIHDARQVIDEHDRKQESE